MRDSPAPPPDLLLSAALAPIETRRARARQRLWARLQRTAARVEHTFDRARAGLRRRFGHVGPLSILTYRGFGTKDRVVVLGRVVEAPNITLPQATDTAWQNVLRMFRHFNTREVPEAELEVRFAGTSTRVRTDEEGYFRSEFPRPPLPPASDQGREPGRSDGDSRDHDSWHPVDLELCGCPLPGWAPLATRTEVLIPGPGATLGIVSDIDDTVLQTHVTRRLRMLWITFSRNAHTRLPFPGTTDLYRALVGGPTGTGRNPVFYVSKSPWNLYDFLIEFLDKHGLPRGPLMLRDLGVSAEAPLDFKSARIDEVFAAYPQLPFVLIGDSGERDPDIYVETAARHRGRVRAIYIRDVGSSPARRRQLGVLAEEARRLGTEMLYLAHAGEALAHARRRGLAPPPGWPQPALGGH
jgi:phosphatidate phosphatase APP1